MRAHRLLNRVYCQECGIIGTSRWVCARIRRLTMIAQTLRRQFTIHDYARMREAGILTEDDRVELLDGEIYLMSPIGPLHIAIANRLTKLLMRQVGDDAILSIQNAIQLDDYSEPRPDVALLYPVTTITIR